MYNKILPALCTMLLATPGASRFLEELSRAVIFGLCSLLFTGTAMAQISADFSSATGGGAVLIGASSSTCNSSTDGGLRFNSTSLNMEYCDGSTWRALIAAVGSNPPAMPPSGSGYFVMSAGTWNGDLKTAGSGATGLAGADALCLSDLTANNWLGKSTAQANGQLVASKVKAFLCDGSVCNSPLMSIRYYFAISGDATKGGAYFDADTSQNGQAGSVGWNGTNYFGNSYPYWASRGLAGSPNTDTVFLPASTATNSRSAYTFAGAAFGASGLTSASDRSRWSNGTTPCSSLLHLVCLVNP